MANSSDNDWDYRFVQDYPYGEIDADDNIHCEGGNDVHAGCIKKKYLYINKKY